MVNNYVMNVRIEIGTDVAKKNGVRDVILAQLNTAKTATNINAASWSIQEIPITEGGTI